MRCHAREEVVPPKPVCPVHRGPGRGGWVCEWEAGQTVCCRPYGVPPPKRVPTMVQDTKPEVQLRVVQSDCCLHVQVLPAQLPPNQRWLPGWRSGAAAHGTWICWCSGQAEGIQSLCFVKSFAGLYVFFEGTASS